MRRADYEILAQALRAGVASAVDEVRPGGVLSDLTAEQVQQMAVVFVAGITDHLAANIHTFNPEQWLATCGMLTEVTTLRHPESAREYGRPVSFDDVRPGDWIRYENRPGHPVVGRVRRRTDLVVRTEQDRSMVHQDVTWSGYELRRSRWGRLHVTLVDPAEVWWRQDTDGDEPDEEPSPEAPVRVPRAEAEQRAMAAAQAYLAEHGHLRVPAKHVQDGYRLGRWIASQRYEYRRGILNPDRLRALDELHVSWRDGCEVGVHR